MVEEPIEESYFKWLCAHVTASTAFQSFSSLLSHLHQTPFSWIILGDDNRAEDGRDLRINFAIVSGHEVPAQVEAQDEWWAVPASVLEVLIAFSQKAEFQTDEPAASWFWEMIRNIGLGDIMDGNYDPVEVDSILNNFIWRSYDRNGDGGLFPLAQTSVDQREVEIWYQFCYYVEEQGRV
jgi:hypothetical protein